MTTPPSDDEFSLLGADPPLAAALAARGYLTPTPVQAEVLGAPDRDLLVSSQTGSGKTIAFGLVMGRALLAGAARVTPSAQPRALVVTPTRELAAQVRGELEWLFAEAGARVVAFTGGTDLRGDARTIQRGVDIAVGTPGRLVDLLERKSLSLDRVEILVLDEADEMLDMGFREAIEAILGRASARRRTLLFSATLPPAITALGRKFQNDPISLGLAARPGAARHADISYHAHLCHPGERVKALVNLLRLAGEERALVFCRTRDAVSDLARELSSRGFLVAAIAGDRAQAERDRALATMRAGRVRVLVATNVAARGLDLPELGLVIHADLPENVEALTHRSGRTGRAGKKGRSLFLVEANARRRAERLFREAGLKISFTAAPGLDEVTRHDEGALRAELLAQAAGPISESAARLARELVLSADPAALVGALVERVMSARPSGEPLTKVALAPEPRRAPGPSGRPGPEERGEFALFEINLGERDRATANWILPLLCRRGGITRREVGAIRVAADRTLFEVAARAAEEFAQNAAEPDPRAPHVRIGPSRGTMPERSLARPVPPKRGPRPHPAEERIAKRGAPPRGRHEPTHPDRPHPGRAHPGRPHPGRAHPGGKHPPKRR